MCTLCSYLANAFFVDRILWCGHMVFKWCSQQQQRQQQQQQGMIFPLYINWNGMRPRVSASLCFPFNVRCFITYRYLLQTMFVFTAKFEAKLVSKTTTRSVKLSRSLAHFIICIFSSCMICLKKDSKKDLIRIEISLVSKNMFKEKRK